VKNNLVSKRSTYPMSRKRILRIPSVREEGMIEKLDDLLCSHPLVDSSSEDSRSYSEVQKIEGRNRYVWVEEKAAQDRIR
jgi:hypothetical protein